MTTTTLLLACLGFAGVMVFFLLVRGASGRPGPTGSATRKSHDRRVTLGADGFTFTDAYLTPGTEIVYEADRANGMTRGTFMMTKSPVWVYLGNAPLAVRLLPGRLPGFVETPSADGFGRGGRRVGAPSFTTGTSGPPDEPTWRLGGSESSEGWGGGVRTDDASGREDAPYQGGGGESGGGGSTDSWGSEDGSGGSGDLPSAY